MLYEYGSRPGCAWVWLAISTLPSSKTGSDDDAQQREVARLQQENRELRAEVARRRAEREIIDVAHADAVTGRAKTSSPACGTAALVMTGCSR